MGGYLEDQVPEEEKREGISAFFEKENRTGARSESQNLVRQKECAENEKKYG